MESAPFHSALNLFSNVWFLSTETYIYWEDIFLLTWLVSKLYLDVHCAFGGTCVWLLQIKCLPFVSKSCPVAQSKANSCFYMTVGMTFMHFTSLFAIYTALAIWFSLIMWDVSAWERCRPCESGIWTRWMLWDNQTQYPFRFFSQQIFPVLVLLLCSLPINSLSKQEGLLEIPFCRNYALWTILKQKTNENIYCLFTNYYPFHYSS